MTIEELRVYGLQGGSLNAVLQHVRALERDGLSKDQIARAVANIHPVLFGNLRLLQDGTLSIVDKRLLWVRRGEWTTEGRKCVGCSTVHWKREFIRGNAHCAHCRYIAKRRRWDRERRKAK